MADDGEDLCVCFHVPLRKIVTFIRLNKPRVASQCSECFGAGTGCGWCIPFIEQVFEQMNTGDTPPRIRMSGTEYRARRREYLARVKMDRMAPEPPPGPAAHRDGEPMIDPLEDSAKGG
jgi:NAD(P)H-nitrite reductase large subunit